MGGNLGYVRICYSFVVSLIVGERGVCVCVGRIIVWLGGICYWCCLCLRMVVCGVVGV